MAAVEAALRIILGPGRAGRNVGIDPKVVGPGNGFLEHFLRSQRVGDPERLLILLGVAERIASPVDDGVGHTRHAERQIIVRGVERVLRRSDRNGRVRHHQEPVLQEIRLRPELLVVRQAVGVLLPDLPETGTGRGRQEGQKAEQLQQRMLPLRRLFSGRSGLLSRRGAGFPGRRAFSCRHAAGSLTSRRDDAAAASRVRPSCSGSRCSR